MGPFLVVCLIESLSVMLYPLMGSEVAASSIPGTGSILQDIYHLIRKLLVLR